MTRSTPARKWGPATRSGYSAPDQKLVSSATELAEATPHIDEVVVLGQDPLEPTARRDHIASPIVKVSQDVPLAQMVISNPLRSGGSRLHQSDGSSEVATIRQRAGRHDAALGHDLVCGGHALQLIPHGGDLTMSTERSEAIHEHRQGGWLRSQVLGAFK